MPNVWEVFQMTTQKVEPELGFVERQHDHRRRRDRNRKIGAFAVVAMLAAAVSILIVTTRPGANSQRPADDATVAPLPVPPGFTATIVDLATGRGTPLDGLTGGAKYAASPDGMQIAFGTCCGIPARISVGNIDGTEEREVAPPVGFDAYGPYWSPDGTELVYQQRPGSTNQLGSLMVQDLATGQTTELATLEGKDAWWYLGPSFSPDGRTVIFQQARVARPGFDVWSVPATGGKPTKLLEDAGFPRYFPDGERIVFVAGMRWNLRGERLVIAEPDGSLRTLATGAQWAAWPAISPDGTRVAYTDGPSIVVVDVATGASEEVAEGSAAEWVDDGSLIVSP